MDIIVKNILTAVAESHREFLVNFLESVHTISTDISQIGLSDLRKKVLEQLDLKYPDISSIDQGLTHLAAKNDCVEVVEFLLNKGADIEAKNNLGTTALMLAAQRGHKETVKYLLNKGADI